MKPSKQQIQEWVKKGLIKPEQLPSQPASTPKAKKPCRYKAYIKQQLSLYCLSKQLELEEELKFLPNRRYAFDFAIRSLKIAVEYEGLNSKKSRHTTITGYTGDTEKYHLAMVEGWRVIRLTVINYKTVLTKLEDVILSDAARQNDS